MATSTNYGWAEPDNSSLVKNGASDIRTLGNAIDTSLWNSGFGQAGKNRIINGDFNIWQRGTSFTSTATGFYYSADRWVSYAQSGTSSTISRQAFTAGTAPVAGYESQYFIRFNDTAGSGTTLFQRIEDVRTFAGQTVTVSYWIKSAGTTTITTNLSQNFGSGGSSAVNNQAIAPYVPTSSWVRVSGTVTLPAMTGKTIGTSSYLEFQINGSATNVAVDVWGVQVEYGSKATPFQTASGGSIQGELAMCQRYYFRNTPASAYGLQVYGATYATNTVLAGVTPPVTMRVTPTSVDFGSLQAFDVVANASYTISALVFASAVNGPMSIGIEATATGATAGRPMFIRNNNNTAGYLGFSAEL